MTMMTMMMTLGSCSIIALLLVRQAFVIQFNHNHHHYHHHHHLMESDSHKHCHWWCGITVYCKTPKIIVGQIKAILPLAVEAVAMRKMTMTTRG
jgi:hypothetical protein